ncbi:MAG TPA: ATP phosphoribosyltransferase regulatory subunit [bacterium]|nr:ATP phosphoribosyltransferase regulatory subunit [bacterium]
MRLRESSTARWRQLPDGLRDLPPREAARRGAVASALRETFQRWGYREVVTPTLEFLETIVQGAGPGLADRLFKIVDRGGELLALRPEITVPIARLAATRLLREEGRPLRLAYVGSVFRGQDAGSGRLREFTQAGVELLGAGEPEADAEVIALAAEALARCGVRGAVIHVGDLAFLSDALAGLPEGEQEEVRQRLYRREFAGLEAASADPSAARLLRALPRLHGPGTLDRAAVFARSPRGTAALQRLGAVLACLEDYGVTDVEVDLAIIRDFSYYTGLVFEAYGPGTGYPLLGGGRYDALLGRFGADCPATGFAIGVERLSEVAVPREASGAAEVVVTATARDRRQALLLAEDLRRRGRSVVVAAAPSAVPPAARFLIRVGDGEILLTDRRAEGAGERPVTRAQLAAELGLPPAVGVWSH